MTSSPTQPTDHQQWQLARESVASSADALHYLFEALAHSPSKLLKGEATKDTIATINAANGLFAQAGLFFSLSRHTPENVATYIQQQGIASSRLPNLTAIASLDDASAEFIQNELNAVFKQINWEAVPAAIVQGKNFDPFTRLRIDAQKAGTLPAHTSLGDNYQKLAAEALTSITTLNRYPHVQQIKAVLDDLSHSHGKGV